MGRLWSQVPSVVKRRLGWSAVACVGVPWLLATAAKTAFQPGIANDPDHMTRFIDILAISASVFALSMVCTVALGCVLVAAMKGPAYLGDEFPADRP
ncbi:MAG TPA: hypothetical protein PKV56_13595 [Burkholderiaceae bacterium]|jgi:hypothetical protein|nr:hypothetical protein [Burkholderiaceae bacterium]